MYEITLHHMVGHDGSYTVYSAEVEPGQFKVSLGVQASQDKSIDFCHMPVLLTEEQLNALYVRLRVEYPR